MQSTWHHMAFLGLKRPETRIILTEPFLRVVLDELALVDGPDTELSLHRCDEGRPLEQSSGQTLQSLHRNHRDIDLMQTTFSRVMHKHLQICIMRSVPLILPSRIQALQTHTSSRISRNSRTLER